MKKIEEDLLKLKIDIQTKKDIAYQEMALLLDKPRFLQMLPRLRNEYLISEFVPLNKFTNFFYDEYSFKHYDNKSIIYLDKYTKIGPFKKQFPDHYKFLTNKKKVRELSMRLTLECNLLCFEFSRPSLFSDIIKQALFCNEVDDYFYWSATPYIFDLFSEAPVPEAVLPQAAILVTPTATYVDVKESFKLIKQMMKDNESLSYYRPRLDFVNNIRQYRLWYWQRLKGKTYQKIADDYIESKLPAQYSTTYQDVIKGVKIYEKLLAS